MLGPRRRRWLPVALALATAGATPLLEAAMAHLAGFDAPVAWAQDGHEARYKQHMGNGVKLYQDKNLQAAIAEFEAAYKTKPKASPLLNIALCYKGQFRYPQAIAALETAIGKHADSMSAADKKAAEDAITELKALLGYVKLQLTPESATVSVDGEDLPKGAAAKPIPLGPGTHKLRARADGYADGDAQVAVASGDKDKPVVLTLTPDKGWVTIKARERTHSIAIDQKTVGSGSWTGFLSPGTHLVQIYKPGAATGFSQQVVVAAGKVHDVKEGDPTLGPGTFFPDGVDRMEPEKPPPVFQGFYGLAQVGVYTVVGEMAGDPGFAVGARLGWRPSTIVGLEAMFQYGHAGDLSGGTSFESREVGGQLQEVSIEGTHVAVDSFRFGGNLRLMTRGRIARFVGTIGPGLSIDVLDYKASECSPATDPNFGLIECYDNDNSGVGFYVNTEFGIEFDFKGLFFGAAIQNMFSSLGGVEGPDLGELMLQTGLHLRLGYGTW